MRAHFAAPPAIPTYEMLVADRNALLKATKDTVRMLEAVRYTVGLRKKQLDRIEAAKAAIAKAEGRS